MKGDRDLLTQLLQNLIDNAIKYNLPEGSPHRRLVDRGAAAGEQRKKLRLVNASRDIPPEERDRLFDRFYRGRPIAQPQTRRVWLGD